MGYLPLWHNHIEKWSLIQIRKPHPREMKRIRKSCISKIRTDNKDLFFMDGHISEWFYDKMQPIPFVRWIPYRPSDMFLGLGRPKFIDTWVQSIGFFLWHLLYFATTLILIKKNREKIINYTGWC